MIPSHLTDPNLTSILQKLNINLERIAVALEAVAKQNVPNFKSLAEIPRQKR